MIDNESIMQILADPENMKCTCSAKECEWREKCRECVAIHRYYKSVPGCLQSIGKEKSEESDIKQ